MNMAKNTGSKYHKDIQDTVKLAEKYGFLKRSKKGVKLNKGFKEIIETFPTHNLRELSEQSGYSPESIALCGMVNVQLSKHHQESNDELADKIMLIIEKFPEVQSVLSEISKIREQVSPTYIG